VSDGDFAETSKMSAMSSDTFDPGRSLVIHACTASRTVKSTDVVDEGVTT
jgi:hypothetical protein